MGRGISYCPKHGEYMEFGPSYDCPDCENESASANDPMFVAGYEAALVHVAERLNRIGFVNVEEFIRTFTPGPSA